MPGPIHFVLRDTAHHDSQPIVPAYGYGCELDDDRADGVMRIRVCEMAYLGEHVQPADLECYHRIEAHGGGILIDRQREIIGMDHPEPASVTIAVDDQPQFMRRRIIETRTTDTSTFVTVRFETYESLET
jgi:hypothetical protein